MFTLNAGNSKDRLRFILALQHMLGSEKVQTEHKVILRIH